MNATSIPKKSHTPFILLTLAVGSLINFLPIFLPFLSDSPVRALGWVMPLVSCSAYLLLKLRSVTLPVGIWVLWAMWVLVYLFSADAENAFQRSVMLLTPLVVGMAFSTIRVDFAILRKCRKWLLFFVFIYLISTWVQGASGAAGVITASLLAAWLVAGYSLQRRKSDLLLWLLLSAVPVISLTRMGILAVGSTLPATLAPLSFKRRMFFVGILAIAGVGVFQMESVQQKMFFSGQGTLTEALESGIAMISGKDDLGTDDFRTNARKAMTLMLRSDIENAYWFGHGANAVEEITSQYFGGLRHPHNDWLRLQYDYGTLGMLIFALAMLLQMISAWRVARKLDGEASRFMYAGASAFIPMAMFMLTDNVIMYVAWFGNLHFAMLGIGYASLRSKKAGLL